jgi:eukaryotic-like serine/threonine-protein kinase
MQQGSVFGHYKILHLIGKGGMGEVWKARDSKLNREVAIKALPKAVAGDREHVARLGREAKALAALNHPNIAAIYGFEEFDSTAFLVLELVEGATLADRLKHAALQVEDALKLALQIAESLEAAHEKGIIHRDLKPANIKVTAEGRVKVLDFGLAKVFQPDPGSEVTRSAIATETGVVMGTPAYMSPEQARGETVGRQTDIWSFGVVLFEMLTGVSPFGRKTMAETLAQVLAAQPDYTVIPRDVPTNVARLVRRLLERDPKRRLQHMGDIRIEIEDALTSLKDDGATAASTPAAAAPRGGRLTRAALVSAIVILAGLAGWFLARRSVPRISSGVVRLSLPFFERPFVGPTGTHHLAISSDGSRIAYASTGQLWVRRLNEKDASPIGTEGYNPFFSPDGRWVGVFSGDAALVKVPVDGGAAATIALTTERPGGGTWGRDGTIVFATTGGLYQVAENAGTVQLLVRPDRQKRERAYAWPQFLPDGRSILFTIIPEESAKGMQIALLDLKTRAIKPLFGGSFARYVSTGHLVYASGTTLKAIAFDANTRETRGDAIAFPDIEVGTAADNGASDFAVSDSGTLVFISTPAQYDLETLRWIDRQGKEEPLPVEPRVYSYARVSPDGTRLALDVGRAGSNRDIWILDLKRLTQVRLTDGPTEDMLPVWSLDGRRIFFASDRGGNFDIYSQAADGATGAKLEFASPGLQAPQSFSPDGTLMIVYDQFKDTGVLNLARPGHLDLLLRSEFDERLGQLSPDGKWIAYESDESGNKFEIFVRPFPNVSDRREKISINGGRFPLWGRTGSDELYYVNLDGEMMAVSVKVAPDLRVGGVTKLFDWVKPPAGRSGRQYDISPIDGRFLMTKPVAPNTDGPTYASVILDWFDELKKRAPAK